MARPRGHPKSGGRKKGTPNKATLVREQELAAGGELPLDYMLRVMRDPAAENSRRDDMAKAASAATRLAPFVDDGARDTRHLVIETNGNRHTREFPAAYAPPAAGPASARKRLRPRCDVELRS